MSETIPSQTPLLGIKPPKKDKMPDHSNMKSFIIQFIKIIFYFVAFSVVVYLYYREIYEAIKNFDLKKIIFSSVFLYNFVVIIYANCSIVIFEKESYDTSLVGFYNYKLMASLTKRFYNFEAVNDLSEKIKICENVQLLDVELKKLESTKEDIENIIDNYNDKARMRLESIRAFEKNIYMNIFIILLSEILVVCFSSSDNAWKYIYQIPLIILNIISICVVIWRHRYVKNYDPNKIRSFLETIGYRLLYII